MVEPPSPELNSAEQIQPAWLEVSLTVDGELAEAVAEVLARYIPDGVAIQATQIIMDPDGEGTGVGPYKVCGYLPLDAKLEGTRRKLEEALWYLGRIQPLPPAVFTPVGPTNWAETWKEHYYPIPVGQKLVILPAWIDETPSGRLPIRIDPGMAFGTGTHPTTQLCLEILQDYLVPGRPVIDVGCGSGILSIACLKLGASQALGVDIDPEAQAAALENARLNGVEQSLQVETGSIHEIQGGQFGIRQAPMVLANILAGVIVKLLDAGLAELVAPGGVLVLSGILEPQLAGLDGHVSVLEALQRHKLTILEQRQIRDWVALVVKRMG